MSNAGFYSQLVQTHSLDELRTLYNIEINPSGSVFDPDENCRFETLLEWAHYKDNNDGYILSEDDQPLFEKIHHKNKFDDERY